MDRSFSKLTCEQLEQVLSQRIQALYRTHLDHQLGNVSCKLFDEKLVIVIEGSITQSEQLLVNRGQAELAQQVRSDLNKSIQPQLKALIEEVINVPVLDLLSDSTLETGFTGSIAVLATVSQSENSSFRERQLSTETLPPR